MATVDRNPSSAVRRLAERIERGEELDLPDGWQNTDVVLEAYRLLAERSIDTTPDYPGHAFDGRGIVICAGGERLFTNAWVCLRMLRKMGCTLPVQFWYLDECEMDDCMRDLVRPFGVECVDASDVAKRHPARHLNGWEVKCFALLHCPFEEVMLLDADNVPVKDPTHLFDTPQFREHGALFWPDFGRLERDRLIWKACGVTYRDEPEFESGQIVVDKRRCWRALNLAMHYNEHSDFYYLHVHGDKDTYHLAFRRLEKSYAMPKRSIHALDATMCQHDFNGDRIFQHRNLDKWLLNGTNRFIDGFRYETDCRKFLSQLSRQWNGRVHWKESPSSEELRRISEIGGHHYLYERVGFDQRTLELLVDRTIGHGALAMEVSWSLNINGEAETNLVLFGEAGPTCVLHPVEDDGAWVGRWGRFEKMPIRLSRLDRMRQQVSQ